MIETEGGLTPHTVSYVSYLSKRATGKGARDATKYGDSRASTRSYFTHHVQRLSVAAQVGNVRGIRKEVNREKQRLAAASASPGGAGA